MSKQSSAAYISGFMDGEGSFSIARNYEIKRRVDGSKMKCARYQLKITIANTNQEVLQWIMKRFGGQIYTKKSHDGWKTRYDWCITSNEKREKFILSILPYLIVKRKQALVAIDFLRLGNQENPEERNRLRNEMLKLNGSSQPHDSSSFHPKPATTNTSDISEISE